MDSKEKRNKLREKENKDYDKIYEEISELTGIKLEETCEYSYCVVMNPEHELAGKVGAYVNTLYPFHYFKFKEKRKLIGFDDLKTRGRNPEIYLTRDVFEVMQQREIAIELAEEIPLLRKKKNYYSTTDSSPNANFALVVIVKAP